jgi:hypothetical protein
MLCERAPSRALRARPPPQAGEVKGATQSFRNTTEANQPVNSAIMAVAKP